MPELPVVARVDLERYAGTWYEIASYPNSFQKGCVATKATYSALPGGKVRVLNECRRGSLSAEWDSAVGRAWTVDTATNAKLKVSFFWPFRGDYWVLDLGAEYEYSVVGTPSREYLWILSRSPIMDPVLYQRILETVRRLGFDPQRLRKTQQS
ncbi:MAG: lipocalin family protein [Deferrisomatales bacterium]|nr:lipocalin family protein [Deferrisomatales bacterium]